LTPETRYARSGDLAIAYQVIGDGPIDLVIVPGIISHVEFFHEVPGYTDFLSRLARFARVITFDKRGSGLSDRPADVGTLEERIDDMRAVMDAVGSDRAAIVGWSEGGPMSLLYAATHPDRVTHLVTCASMACYVGSPDRGAVMVPEVFPTFVDVLVEQWGTGWFCEYIAPSIAADANVRRFLGRLERQSASPQTMRGLWDAVGKMDVRPVLSAVTVPTLVVRRRDEVMPPEPSHYIAAHIPGARYVEVPGEDHVPWLGDLETYVGVIEEFVTGQPSAAVPDDRVLATVLFTDIVGSTARAADLGDRRWHEVLDAFQSTVRREVARYRGREVNTRGDDFLVTFDGPARALRCALAITDAAAALGLDVRSGVHTGEVELHGDDLAGIAVHIGARVSALAAPGEVLATTTVRDLVVGSGIAFADRGEHELRGVPGCWSLVAVAR
jgi:pimeloyl-ACP methyl ester carboxylesterase/class 3 adenylate cyclase